LLPIITIGLTEACTPVAERIAAGHPLAHFETAEAAYWALDGAALPFDTDLPSAPIWTDGDPRAHVHVIYGELSFGPAITATEQTLEPWKIDHTGATIALVDRMGADQTTVRRVVNGTAEQFDTPINVFSAVGMLRCTDFGAADQLDARGEKALIERIERFDRDSAAAQADV
jgi:hypothetical protein